MRTRASTPCPCGSGEPYHACCRSAHQGAEPSSLGRLVRARFAAFALGDGAFLVRTLAEGHALRARPTQDVVRELSRARQQLRYRAVEVRDERAEGERGEALFEARIFEKGRDRSFVERSRFVLEDGGWRYLDGDLVPVASPRGAARTLDAFDRAAEGGAP